MDLKLSEEIIDQNVSTFFFRSLFSLV